MVKRAIVTIRDGDGGDEGGWFGARVSRVLGDGKNTFFWFDNWLGDVPLRRRFGRLFDLATHKLITVADMFELGWEEGGVEVEEKVVDLGGRDVGGM